jgi:DNA-binding PadR family transcriptional regulator
MISWFMTSPPPKRSPPALAILVLLCEEPMHVYRMRRLIKLRGEDEVINVGQPNSVYQTITRLRRQGLLTAGPLSRLKNRPERTIYCLTDPGRAILLEWTREMLSTPSHEFPEFPAAISVLAVLTPKDVLKQFEKRITALETDLAHLRIRRKAAIGLIPRLFLIEVEFLLYQTLGEIRWVKSIANDLRT